MVVSHQGGLSSGWSLIRVVSQQGALSSGCSQQGGLSSVWYLLGWSLSGWSFTRLVRVVFHQGGLSSGWSLGRVVSRQGGLPSGWSLNRVVFQQDCLSSGSSFIRSSTVFKSTSPHPPTCPPPSPTLTHIVLHEVEPLLGVAVSAEVIKEGWTHGCLRQVRQQVVDGQQGVRLADHGLQYVHQVCVVDRVL